MALKVQIGALAETFCPQERVQHAHHFSALLIHRQGVKVGDFNKGVRANRMSHRARVFGKLIGAQEGDIFNAFDGV